MIASTSELHTARSRVLTFEGGLNFRDIGGYTAGQRTVRWGKVFRAGVLCYFTPNDHAPLTELGVRTICDLRRAEEREREPTRWPDSVTKGLFWDDGGTAPTVRGFAAKRPKTAVGMRESMLTLYKALPVWMAPRIKGMFDCIMNGDIPLVVHCAAGKDRTGVAVAVLLGALGVGSATIVEDYLLTNAVGDFESFFKERTSSQLGVADAQRPLLSMEREMRDVLLRADPDYLQAALDLIDGDLGGMDRYLKTVVGLDDRILAQVRDALLE